MNTTVTVRLATYEECLEILSEPRLLSKFDTLSTVEELKEYLHKCIYPHYIVKQGEYSLLFKYSEFSKYVYEIHPACPEDSIKASRRLTLDAIAWILTKEEALAVTAKCPHGVATNFAAKLGAQEIFRDESHARFILTKRVLLCH